MADYPAPKVFLDFSSFREAANTSRGEKENGKHSLLYHFTYAFFYAYCSMEHESRRVRHLADLIQYTDSNFYLACSRQIEFIFLARVIAQISYFIEGNCHVTSCE